MTLLHDARATIRQLPDLIIERMYQWEIGVHHPADPGAGDPWCLRCMERWPCDRLFKIVTEHDATRRLHP